MFSATCFSTRGAARLLATLLTCGLIASDAWAQAPTPAQLQLRELYKELVEINTTDSTGSCTLAAEAMQKRLIAGGMATADIQIIVPPGAPKKGNLVARLRGTGAVAVERARKNARDFISHTTA